MSIEQHILDYLNGKPAGKNLFVFKANDVYQTPRKSPTSEVIGQRRRMGLYIFRELRNGPLTIQGYQISIHIPIVPYRYIARRTTV